MEVAVASDDIDPGDTYINDVRLVKLGMRYRLAVDFWNNLRIQTVYMTKGEAKSLLERNRNLWFKLLYEANEKRAREWMKGVLKAA